VRRTALTLVLVLLLLLPLTSVAQARPQAASDPPCTLEVLLASCPTQVAAGGAITVQWQISSPSIETCTHNDLHWVWYDAQGERTSYTTANQPGLAGSYTATFNAPAANGYIEVQAHAWTGRCSDISERQAITVGDPPARRYILRLPQTSCSLGRLAVSSVQTSNAQGMATVTVLGQPVQVFVTSMQGQPIAGIHIVGAAAGSKVLLAATDPALHYAPGFLEANLPASGGQLVPFPFPLMATQSDQALYSTLIPMPSLLASFAQSQACLGARELASLAAPDRAVFLILFSTGGISLATEIVGGILSTDATEAAITAQWAGTGMPTRITARIWSHHDIPVIFVEMLGSCEPAQ
jgi:hypothetical protein